MKEPSVRNRLLSVLLGVAMLLALFPFPASVSAAGSITTLWNMETLPDDLVANAIAVPYYPDTSDYIPGNVTLTSVSGRGYNGSKALAVSLVGASSWADVFTLYPERDYGASYSIGDADMLWFWINLGQFSRAVSLDLRVDGRYTYIGDTYYVSSGSGVQAKTIPDSWDGIHGRIVLNAAFKGWVGVPMTSFVTEPNNLASLFLSVSADAADQGKSKTVYIDEFCVSSGNAAPGGLNFSGISYPGAVATADISAWDMESLPDDLLAAGLAVSSGSIRNNLRVRRCDGKGFGGSAALQVMQYGPCDASEVLTLNAAAAEDFARNWRSGDMLMFWADTLEFSGQSVTLDLTVGGKKLTPSTAWYKERGGLLVKSGTLAEPYEGAGFGVLTLPEGFCGWVGLPLTSFKGGVHDASSVKLSLSFSGTDVLHKSLYLDEFRVITGNRMPAGTVTDAGTADVLTVLNANAQPDSSRYLNTNVSTTYQTMQSYGASDCWWTNVIGTRSNIRDALDLLWGTDGIGLTTYRLNIGGAVQYSRSDSPVYSGRAALSPLNESGELDITRNAGSWNTYSTLLDMIDDGDAQINDLTLFMNSPPSSMMTNGHTYADTLASDKYDDYGRFVADVVEAYENTGLHVKYVSPVNEPLVGNWTNNAGQEGTVYTQASQIISVFENSIDALNDKGSSTKISVSDFCNWSSASQYFSSIITRTKIKNNIDHISGHDYGQESASYRSSFASTVHNRGLSVHMSEWCMNIGDNADNMDTALQVAKEIYTDLTAMNCDSWSWWLAVGGGGFSDGLTYYSAENNIIETTKRLWALGNFSRFTVGATRIGVNTSHLPSGIFAMAFKKDSSLIYTLINENNSAASLSLAGLPAGATATMYETSEARNCELVGHVLADNAVSLPARSIVTLVFDGIDMSAVSSNAAPRNASAGRMLNMENANVSGGFSTNRPTLVSAYRASGAGFNGSDAAALSYNVWDSTNYWDTAFRLSPAALGGSSNWSAGDTLWFWADACDFISDTYLQVDINDGSDRGLTIGSTVYLWDGSGTPAADTAVKTWDGATTGRLRIPAGYCGFIGIPMSCFSGLNRSSVRHFSFYFEPEHETLPAVLYLDEFWLTASGRTPDVTFSTDAPVCKDIYDMETLSEDLTVNSAFSTFTETLGVYVDPVLGQADGCADSSALGYRYLQSGSDGNGSNVLMLNTAQIPGFDRDWSGAETLWIWVDANEFDEDCQLGVNLNWNDLSLGNSAKFWRGSSVQAAQIPVAYNDVARVVVPAGYVGFIGLPLDGYTVNGALDLSNIHTVIFYYDCGSEALPVTLWLDELWVTDGDSLPLLPACTHGNTCVLAAVAPTCVDSGLTEGLQCADCGEILTAQQSIPATGEHQYANGFCSVCGAKQPINAPAIREAYPRLAESINLIFAADIPDDSTDIYMTFTMNGETRLISDYTVDGNGRYCFEYASITPQRMGDTIVAVLHATCSGRNYTDTVSGYSIRIYCANQLAKTTDARLITLLSDLLTYGAAAQEYTGYRTDALVTEGLSLSPSTFDEISGKAEVFSGSKSEAADWKSASLLLSNRLGIRFTFRAASTDGLEIAVSHNGSVQIFTEKDFISEGNGIYSVIYRGIKATEFDDAVTAQFRRSDEPFGRSITYSVSTYICSTQDNCEIPALAELVQAISNYGNAAKAYAAE